MKDVRGLVALAIQLALFYYLGPLILLLLILALPVMLAVGLCYVVYQKIPREDSERKAMRKRIKKMLKKNLSYLP